MHNLKFRPPLKQESYKLAVLFTRSFKKRNSKLDQIKKVSQIFKAEIQTNLVKFLVVEEGDHFIAMGGETRHLGSSYIGFLGVIPERRKLGIGSAVFQQLLYQSSTHNPTVELFSNLEAVNLYQNFNFEGEFYTHIFKLKKKIGSIDSNIKVINSPIPKWIHELDRKAMGFDRSYLLEFLIENRRAQLASVENDGYAILTDDHIGPLIAKDNEVAKSLIKHCISHGANKLISSIETQDELEPLLYKKLYTCLKMRYGAPLYSESSWIWSYHSLATS